MATTTWNCNKDTRVAQRQSDSAELGSGASDGLPVGLYSGYLYRSYLGFSYSFSGMTTITSAILHIRTSSQIHVAFGSDPDVLFQRITTSWSEGTAVSLSASNATHWGNQPTRISTNQVTVDVSTSESDWITVDVTDLVNDAKSAGVFYGIGIRAVDEGTSTDVTEFYSREWGSSDAYITVTYTTVVAPDAPTAVTPTAGAFLNDTTPDLTFTHKDDDGHSSDFYQVQVSTSSGFGTTVFDSGSVAGVIAHNSNFTVNCTTTLTRGTQYYVRARSSDATSGYGPWTSAIAFKVAQTPTITITEPAATGRLGKLSFTAGSGWASPRLNVAWTFGCADAGTQSSYEIEVYNDSAGSPGSSLYDSGTVASAASSLVVPATLTEGSYYHVRGMVTCSHGESSAFTGYFRIRTRWGVVVHRKDLTSAPLSWSITTLNTTTGASSAVTLEYGSDSAANATPSSGWKSSLSAAPLARYFYYRAWLMAWGTSPATSPSLDKLVLTSTSDSPTADNWTAASVATIDPGTYVYGTQSLKHLSTGAGEQVSYQTIPVVPNTNYVLSGRIKSDGNSGASLRIADTAGVSLSATTALAATADWARYSTAVWNSGENTAVRIQFRTNGASSTAAWCDAVKMEASSVVTPWTPGFLGDAVVLDAGGLQVDASVGGIFRLRGSTGGSRDLVEVGATGLKFGGGTDPEEISSPAANTLKLGDGFLRTGGTSFPSSPTSNDLFYRTDLDLLFFFDGTRWLTSTLYEAYPATSYAANSTYAATLSATQASISRIMLYNAQDMEIYLEDICVLVFVGGGGSALSGSHKWVADISKISAGNAATSLGTLSLDSGSNDWRFLSLAVNATLGGTANYPSLRIDWAMTGTPGSLNITAGWKALYRMVGT